MMSSISSTRGAPCMQVGCSACAILSSVASVRFWPSLPQREIGRICLREQQVEKPPPRAGRAFDQLQVLGAKDHRAQHAEIIGQLAHGPAIEVEAAFSAGPIHLRLVLPLADYFAADEIALLRVPNHLRAADAAKRAQRGDEINGLEDVGLALCVVAQQ